MIPLDTDHCVFLLRGRNEVRAAFEAHGTEKPGISIITVGELYFGALRSARPESNREICQAFIDRVTVVHAKDRADISHFSFEQVAA